MAKVLLIGLDGATWDVLTPLLESGALPTLARLKAQGVSGVLTSIIPPVTGPAWVSFATGKTPGKTGVIDFINRKDHKLSPVTSSDFKGVSFWDYLSLEGFAVGIVNFPMLFPPYEIEGFMISGIGSFTDDVTYPPSLKKELDAVCDGYEVAINCHDKKYSDRKVYFNDVFRVLDKRARAVYHLLRTRDVDILVSIFSCTDWTQHIMWKYLDGSAPGVQSERLYQEFIKFWKRIDDIISTMIELAGAPTVIIMSDHGFGPQDQCFNLAAWLVQRGYMHFKPLTVQGALKEGLCRIWEWDAQSPLGKSLLAPLTKKVGRPTRPLLEKIDFERSTAYCLGHTIPFGAVYIGSDSEKERTALREHIARQLVNVEDDIQEEAKVDIFFPEKMYKGPKTKILPDILFTINDWRCIITESNFKGPLFTNTPYSDRHTGSHRLEGIFIACGPHIDKGEENASICDIAPTVLHIFGLPVPKDMDGKVLLHIFEKDSEYRTTSVVYDSEKSRIERKIKNLRTSKKL